MHAPVSYFSWRAAYEVSDLLLFFAVIPEQEYQNSFSNSRVLMGFELLLKFKLFFRC